MTDYLDPAPLAQRDRADDPYAESASQPPINDIDDASEGLYQNRDLPNFVPSRLRAAIDSRRERWTPVDSLAMAVIGIQLFILFVETVGGSFYLDDLRAQAYALNQPFWSFIMGSNGTHFAPLPRVLDWVQSRVFPLEHGPAVIITLMVRLLFAVTFWRLLRRIFGPRMQTLLPLLLLVVTPALLPATLWYRQSITIVTCTVAMLWALDAHLRWLLGRRPGALAEVVLATALGLGCYEKAAAIPVILLGATIAIFAQRRRNVQQPATMRVARPAALSVLLSTVIVAGFVVIYLSGPYDQGSGSPPSVFDVLHLAWDTATRDVIPLLLGGPYHWTFNPPYAGTAYLTTTAVAIVMVLTGMAILITGMRRPSPLARGCIFLLAWTLPSTAIVSAGRFEALHLVLANATRLWVDLVPAFILAGALAALPWNVGACRSAAPGRRAARPPSEEPDTGSVAGAPDEGRSEQSRPWQHDRREPAELTIPALTTALVLVAIAVGSGVSTVSYVSKWWDNPTGDWISAMRASISPAEPYARVLATPLPETVMPLWVSSQLPTSAPLLQLIRPDIRFNDGDGDARALNSSGQLVHVLQGPIASSAPARLCAKPIPIGRKGYTGLRFTTPAPYVSGAQVEIGLLLGEVTPVRVQVLTLDGKRITPQTFSVQALSAGPHVLRYPVPLSKIITGVYVQINATKIGCIVNARVWAPVTGS